MIKLFRRRAGKDAAAARLSYERALDLLIENDRAAAIEQLREAVRQDSADVFAYLRLGDLLRLKGKVENAIKIHADLRLRSGLDKVLDRRIILSLARDYLAAGKFAAATAVLREFPGGVRKDRDGLKLLVSALERQGLWKDALDRRLDLLDLEGRKRDRSIMASYRAQIGWHHLKAGRLDPALSQLEEAIKLDGDNQAALYYLGRFKEAAGDPEGAVEVWDKFVSLFPDRAWVAYPGLEKSLFDLGQLNRIVDRYSSVLRALPGQPETARALAAFYRRMGDDGKCRRTLEDALQVSPENPILIGELASLAADTGDAGTAAELLFKLGPIRPEERLLCRRCGYSSDEPLWYCPSCLAFDSFLG